MHEPSTLQLAILQLKARGLTDHSVARVLNVGERTVRRQLDLLMAGLGVSCRPELYVEVGRRGWLDREPDRAGQEQTVYVTPGW